MKKNLNALVVALVVYVTIAMLTSFVSTHSLNPIDVYRHGNITSMVIVSITLALAIASLLVLGNGHAIRAVIRVSTGQHPDDVRCPHDGLPLLEYIGSHGPPVRCPKCARWWHRTCFLTDESGARTTHAVWRLCPACLEESQRDDLGDFKPSS